eukprot:3674586-Alexandrium_andersonii.AAC.1
MSASLVGSEMCIRDRGVVEAAVAAHVEAVEVEDQLAAAGDHQPHGAAVSYTHLTLPTICSV